MEHLAREFDQRCCLALRGLSKDRLADTDSPAGWRACLKEMSEVLEALPDTVASAEMRFPVLDKVFWLVLVTDGPRLLEMYVHREV